MKSILKLSTSTLRQPFYGETFEHNNEAIAEVADALARGLVGNYSTGDVVILYGCTLTGSASGNGNPFAITAGAIFYNGEIYLVPAKSGTISGTNVLIGTVTVNYPTSRNPVQMDDLSLADMHKDRTIVIDQGTSGGGIGNYTAFRNVLRVTGTQITDNAPGTISSGGTYTLLTSFTFTTPNDGLTRRYRVTFKVNCNGNGTANMNVQIYNTTTSTLYDLNSFQSSSNPSQGMMYCDAIVSIGPNETVEVQKQWIGGSTILAYGKLFYEEVR